MLLILVFLVAIFLGGLGVHFTWRSSDFDTIFGICMVIIIIGIIGLFMGTLGYIMHVSELNDFNRNVGLYENGLPLYPTTATIENINSWLIKAQASRITYGNFSLYPARVLKLDLIGK